MTVLKQKLYWCIPSLGNTFGGGFDYNHDYGYDIKISMSFTEQLLRDKT